MRRISSFGVLICAVLFSACVAEDDPVAGVPRLSVGDEELVELAARELLYQIRDLQMDSAGNVWILSADDPFISVLRPGDLQEISFGNLGGGPAEMSLPWSILPNGFDGVRVWDAGRKRVLEFELVNSTVDFISATRVSVETATVLRDIWQTSYGSPLRMEMAGDIFVLQPAHHPVLNTGDLQEIVLLTGLDPGAFEDTIYSSPLSIYSSQAEFLVPVPLWTGCGDGTVVVLEPPNRLLTLNVQVGTADTAFLPLKSRSLNEDDLRRYLRHLMEVELAHPGRAHPPERVIQQRIDKVMRGARDLFGTIAPSATRLLCDESMNLWFQVFSTVSNPLGLGSEWLVVRNSKPIAFVHFPEGFQPLSIRRSGVYGVRRDHVDIVWPYFISINDQWSSILYPADASLADGI
jgi:hypothetical protein